MIYYAILQPGSAVYRLWRTKHQVSGLLDHVHFFWCDKQYVSKELAVDQIKRLQLRQAKDVQIEAFGVFVDHPNENSSPEIEDTNDKKKPRPRQRL